MGMNHISKCCARPPLTMSPTDEIVIERLVITIISILELLFLISTVV